MPGPAASGLLSVKMKGPAPQLAGGSQTTAERSAMQPGTENRPECCGLRDCLS